MTNSKDCPVCGSQAYFQPDYETSSVFYICPVCGRYKITFSGNRILKNPKLSSYLFYNRFVNDGYFEYRYHTTLSKEKCDEYKREFISGNNSQGHPVHMDDEIIDNWFPKTFSERTDYILLCLNSLIKHIGQSICLSYPELYGLLFVECNEENPISAESTKRPDADCLHESGYMLQCLKDDGYITTNARNDFVPPSTEIALTPKGYSRIDSLQKEAARGNNALVAMKFGDETKTLREAIRQGIKDAHYNPIFIDEVQHNDFITPELLKYIRDSKFVVVDLTHQNNGAYFEEGYAMGLGKSVIQLCKKDTKLHFDIAQKNTIIWATEGEIPERLTNRIKATID